MFKSFFGLMMYLIISVAVAAPSQPLPAEKAFNLTAHVDTQNQVSLKWDIAPGYYLYQSKFKFISPNSPLQIPKLNWPATATKKNFNGESYYVYEDTLQLTLSLTGKLKEPTTLIIEFQGCSQKGLCYAPIKKYFKVTTNNKSQYQLTPINQLIVTSNTKPVISDQDMAQAIFVNHSIVFILFSFLGLGLLLAFTPCVLPMIPILSGIIVGHKHKVSTTRAFSLSLAYVLGMALTYAVAGMIIALLGSSIQVFFQNKWVIILFSGMFVALAFSLFGVYDLQLPSQWHARATRWSNYQKSGSLLGVFIMGCISTLIVSPCVSAPLVGVLAYIAQTGNALFGALALFMMGLGMGIPLLIIGTSAGKWLPKAGHWMDLIKKLFGVLMLCVAVWMLSRIIPGRMSLLLWGTLLICFGIYVIGFYKSSHRGIKFLKTTGILTFVYGLVLIFGAYLGNFDPLSPWDGWPSSQAKNKLQQELFVTVSTLQELQLQLKSAQQQDKIVALDFYADWCTACVFMDQHVFNQQTLHEAMAGWERIRVDVTKNDKTAREIMQYYHVIAPPTILFFDGQGAELTTQRIVGEMNAAKFLEAISRIK